MIENEQKSLEEFYSLPKKGEGVLDPLEPPGSTPDN